jgi:biotin-dependent carboxylase-like uncharacterized protein
LAVAGGIAVAPALGSRATHLVCRMGGLDGRALMAGDRVPLGAWKSETALRGDSKTAPELLQMPDDGHATVRVLAGPDRDRFVDRALDALQSAPYTIAIDSDRMGYRLQGPELRHRSDANIISDATPLGALQVPASEQPLLLMADRQTTGGYPKLAMVISADIGIAGQLGPGDRISFKVCSRKDAIAALIAEERGMMAAERAAGV